MTAAFFATGAATSAVVGGTLILSPASAASAPLAGSAPRASVQCLAPTATGLPAARQQASLATDLTATRPARRSTAAPESTTGTASPHASSAAARPSTSSAPAPSLSTVPPRKPAASPAPASSPAPHHSSPAAHASSPGQPSPRKPGASSPASPTASPSPTPTPAKAQLCVTVQPFSSDGTVRAGTTAYFTLFVWASGEAVRSASVTVTTSGSHLGSPTFSVCPNRDGATCQLGSLALRQEFELEAAIPVGSAASQHQQVQLSATVAGPRALSDSATASVRVDVPQPSSSPSPKPSGPATTQPSVPPVSQASLPAVPPLPFKTTKSSNDPSGLFPTVDPTPTSTPGPTSHHSASGARRVHVVDASATLPLSPRLIGGQLLGLAILAGAIAMAVARLSLRTDPDKGKATSS